MRKRPIIHLSAVLISIRDYLQADRQTENALKRLSHLLIEGIERYSVHGPTAALESLREHTQRVLRALESNAPPDELLPHGSTAMEALKRYNDQVVEYLRQPDEELQAKVKVLTAAITSISSASSENVRRLKQIKSQMLSSVDLKDFRSQRMLLSDCLDGVLVEAERQRAQADRAAEELHRTNRRTSLPVTDDETSVLDPATGLPTRGQAEEAIAVSCQGEEPAFVVVMVINQLQTANRSFGRQLGDAMLQRFAEFMRQQLPAVDQLFRWGGPTIVALVRRKKALDVRAAVEPLLLQRLTVRTGTPDVQVPISARWTVLPLAASPRLLFHKIDGFADCQ